MNKTLRKMYNKVDGYFGDLKWWPARSRFEVIVGAILTQNTSWKNVEKAIKNLRALKLMNIEQLSSGDEKLIQSAVRCTGYFRQKTLRLKEACKFLIDECGRDLGRGRSMGVPLFREKLLSLKGIGPETADCILLYAFDLPVFVVDAYTIRIFERHGLVKGNAKYMDVQNMVHAALGENVQVFNQFHAALVEVGKRFCLKKEGKCAECPLKNMLKKRKMSYE